MMEKKTADGRSGTRFGISGLLQKRARCAAPHQRYRKDDFGKSLAGRAQLFDRHPGKLPAYRELVNSHGRQGRNFELRLVFVMVADQAHVARDLEAPPRQGVPSAMGDVVVAGKYGGLDA